MSGNSSNQIEDLAEDFLDEITFLYPIFDALQGDDSTVPTTAPHLTDCMLEPMICWKKLKTELKTSGVEVSRSCSTEVLQQSTQAVRCGGIDDIV